MKTIDQLRSENKQLKIAVAIVIGLVFGLIAFGLWLHHIGAH